MFHQVGLEALILVCYQRLSCMSGMMFNNTSLWLSVFFNVRYWESRLESYVPNNLKVNVKINARKPNNQAVASFCIVT